ncbi:MAG: AbrB/MazE/SpoVT family DNA-binding domain-containing protein [Candidatus Electrothrix sp. AR3]|nr:AbrB/MazE/SpoVT family DNA-binding domain-containing protein [Candidatus Electrothrix sp. AR3]
MPKRKLISFDLGQQFRLIARGRIIKLISQRTVNEARGMLSGCKCADSSEYRDRNERDTI